MPFAQTNEELELVFEEKSAILRGVALMFFPKPLGIQFLTTLEAIAKMMASLLPAEPPFLYSTTNINVAF